MSQFICKWLICRICLKSGNKLYNLFEPISTDEIKDLGTTLIDKVELCGAIKINQQHNLPNKICNRCILLLRAAYKFIDLCQQSQKQLKQFITTPFNKENSEETLKINFDSDTELQEEVENALLTDVDYVVEERLIEYDRLSYDQDHNSVEKNNYGDVGDENVEMQDFSDEENSQYVVEEIEAKELICEDNEDDDITTYNYEEDSNGDHIIIEEQSQKVEKQFFTKRISEKKPSVKRKRKNSKNGSSNRIYNCTLCDNTYTDKTKYSNHMKIHVKDKPHECEICHKRFSTTPQLSRHMNSHTGNRPYKCHYCDASFGDPSTKIKHERIHTNERPYKCCLCDKAFAYSNVLKVHMMTHTGEKPHICNYCGKSFSQLHHKNAHEKRHTNVNMVLLQNSADIDYMEDDLNDFVEEAI